jgi:hypothetical protein
MLLGREGVGVWVGGYGQSFLKWGGGVGGGVYFLSFSLQVTYTNNITLLVLKYLLIYSELCYDEFHIYSPNFAKKKSLNIHTPNNESVANVLSNS